MKFAVPSLLATTILLTGCAASVQKTTADSAPIRVAAESSRRIAINVTGSELATKSGDWAPVKNAWREGMKSAVTAAGAQFSSQEGEPQSTGEPGTLVVINVNDYRYISAGARYVVGVMTGNAFVDSAVQYRDLKTGAVLGERSYNTTSTAWQGIFSPMTEKQIEAICTDIVSEIKAR